MDEGYNIYLSQNTGNELIVLKLPANPEEIEFKYEINNKKYTVLGIGEVIRIGTKGLKGFTLKSFFPAEDNPDVAIYTIEKMIDNMTANEIPLNFKLNKFQINRLILDINIDVTVDSFNYGEQGGEVGDLEYSIKMTEYREHKARVV